jgi:hypothetical protein
MAGSSYCNRKSFGRILMKYVVDCFTERSVDTKFPENSFTVDELKEVCTIIKNVSRPISGIVKVEVWIQEKDK